MSFHLTNKSFLKNKQRKCNKIKMCHFTGNDKTRKTLENEEETKKNTQVYNFLQLTEANSSALKIELKWNGEFIRY